MSMRKMEELKTMLCEELDEITSKGEISFGDLDNIQKMTSSIKNLDKILKADKYSSGDSYARDDGMMYDRGNTYRDGGSYASRSRHYVRGHYSYNDEAGMLSDKIEEMIADGRMNADDKRTLREALNIIRK